MKALRNAGIALVVIILLLAGFLAWWFLMRATALPAAALVPSNTMVFAHIPNGAALGVSYESSKLKKIVESDEIAALSGLFWAQVMNEMSPEDQQKLLKLQGTLETFAYNFSGESFVAVVDVMADPDATMPIGIMLGFHPLQGSLHFDSFVEEVKTIALEGKDADQPVPTVGTGSHSGIAYEFLDFGDGARMYVAKAGGWILTAPKQDLLHATIDRALGKNTGASLLDSSDYKQMLERFTSPPQLVTYVNMPEVVKAGYGILESATKVAGQTEVDLGPIKSMFDMYKEIRGLAFGSTFDNKGMLRDEWLSELSPSFIQQLGGLMESCAYDTLKFTDKSTIFYSAGSMDAVSYYNMVEGFYTKTPETGKLLEEINNYLGEQDLDLMTNIIKPLGKEYAMLSAWPENQDIPSLGFLITLQDSAAFEKFFSTMIENISGYTTLEDGVPRKPGQMVRSKVGKYELRTYRLTNMPMVSPTFVLGDDLFGVFLSQQGAAATLSSPPDTNFTIQPFWKDLGLNHEGTVQMSFLNLESVVQRSYGMVAPMLQMLMAMDPEMSQQLGDFQIPNKLSFVDSLNTWGHVTINKNPFYDQVSVSSMGSPMMLAPAFGYFAFEAAKEQIEAQAQQQEEMARQLAAKKQAEEAAAAAAAAAAATPEPTSAEAIRDELKELRVVIKAWAKQSNVPEGATVEWSSLQSLLVPGSRLADSGGKDALGNRFKLGRVGEVPADVSWETKKAFPDEPASFWKETAPAEAPSEN